MTWSPRYVGGRLAIVPDKSEDFAVREIHAQIEEIEAHVRRVIASQSQIPLNVAGKIHRLFGAREFVVRSGLADPAIVAADAERDALDAKLNADLDAALKDDPNPKDPHHAG